MATTESLIADFSMEHREIVEDQTHLRMVRWLSARGHQALAVELLAADWRKETADVVAKVAAMSDTAEGRAGK